MISGHIAGPLTSALQQLPGYLLDGSIVPDASLGLKRVASVGQADAALLCVLLRRHFEAACVSCALVEHIERADEEHGAGPAVTKGITQLHVEAKQRLR